MLMHVQLKSDVAKKANVGLGFDPSPISTYNKGVGE